MVFLHPYRLLKSPRLFPIVEPPSLACTPTRGVRLTAFFILQLAHSPPNRRKPQQIRRLRRVGRSGQGVNYVNFGVRLPEIPGLGLDPGRFCQFRAPPRPANACLGPDSLLTALHFEPVQTGFGAVFSCFPLGATPLFRFAWGSDLSFVRCVGLCKFSSATIMSNRLCAR